MADAAVVVFWIAMVGLLLGAVYCLIELLIPPAWLYGHDWEREDGDGRRDLP